jgi:hypothetical protein
MVGARLVSRLTTARGAQCAALTQAFPPGPFSPPCGECASVALGEIQDGVMVEAGSIRGWQLL